jgi:hypothetical protein
MSSADRYNVNSPERRSELPSPVYDHAREPEVSSVDLRQLLAAPGWHIDPPSTAPQSKRATPIQDEDLDSFEGANWVPPAVPAGQEAVALLLVTPRSHRGRKLVIATVALVGVAAGAAYGIQGAKRPVAQGAVPASAAKVSTIVTASIPTFTPLPIDANAVVTAAQKLISSASTGVRVDNAQSRPADGNVLDYVLAITPESVRVGAPDLLRGASNTHVTAVSAASAVAERRAGDPTAAQQALEDAVNGEYQLDLWFNRAGNLIRMTVQTVDRGDGGRIDVAFSDPVTTTPTTAPSADLPLDEGRERKAEPEAPAAEEVPPTTVEVATTTTVETPPTTEVPPTTVAPAPPATEAPTTPDTTTAP